MWVGTRKKSRGIGRFMGKHLLVAIIVWYLSWWTRADLSSCTVATWLTTMLPTSPCVFCCWPHLVCTDVAHLGYGLELTSPVFRVLTPYASIWTLGWGHFCVWGHIQQTIATHVCMYVCMYVARVGIVNWSVDGVLLTWNNLQVDFWQHSSHSWSYNSVATAQHQQEASSCFAKESI